MPVKQKSMYRSSATIPVRLQRLFDIIADVLNQEKVSISETAAQTYTGSAITPTPTIKYGEVTLVKDKDYNLTYTDNVNIGTAKINITFINNYSGTAESSFNIIPDVLNQEKVSISEIAKQKRIQEKKLHRRRQ